jgi:hypothetical protein
MSVSDPPLATNVVLAAQSFESTPDSNQPWSVAFVPKNPPAAHAFATAGSDVADYANPRSSFGSAPLPPFDAM